VTTLTTDELAPWPLPDEAALKALPCFAGGDEAEDVVKMDAPDAMDIDETAA
jgi:hypothetical protein